MDQAKNLESVMLKFNKMKLNNLSDLPRSQDLERLTAKFPKPGWFQVA
jgi:hypothetical protein